MNHWAIIDGAGLVTHCGMARDLARIPEGAILLPEGMTAEIAELCMFAEGLWIYRPKCPQALGSAEGAIVEGCPEGAWATVYDPAAGERLGTAGAVAGVIEIGLPDAGVYVIEVEAPAPWLRSRTVIEVPA